MQSHSGLFNNQNEHKSNVKEVITIYLTTLVETTRNIDFYHGGENVIDAF